jgi:hypothetical protein
VSGDFEWAALYTHLLGALAREVEEFCIKFALDCLLSEEIPLQCIRIDLHEFHCYSLIIWLPTMLLKFLIVRPIESAAISSDSALFAPRILLYKEQGGKESTNGAELRPYFSISS